MNVNDKKKVIAINAILFAALLGLISLNKEILRPALNNSSLMKILTGCFPNFIAAYLFSLASVAAVLIIELPKNYLDKRDPPTLFFVCIQKASLDQKLY